MNRRSARQKAILRRRIFLGGCAAALIAVIALITVAVKALRHAVPEKDPPSTPSTVSSEPPENSETAQSSEETPSYPDVGPNGLDANFSKLLLVNGEHPLPEDYDYEGNLTTIPDKYINGSLKQIDKEVWPYMKAMIEAAWEDGVKLYVWSPYRSYATQNMLFQNRVNKVKTADMTKEEAEALAATVVARPGTSEHHTGLAADFNMASSEFENTPMYEWMQQHAADYGFIMRYRGDKQEITGVIHESWHYRFVGINVAKEINRLDLCLEEYVETRS